jgi:hypothetical protein
MTGGYSRLWHRVVVQARQPMYNAWQAGTTTLCQSRLYPPVRDYEFGNRTLLQADSPNEHSYYSIEEARLARFRDKPSQLL